jgi:hypothetical protein
VGVVNTDDRRSTMSTRWHRIEEGYESGNARIFDNGAGLGPTKGGGRWAVEVDGKWLANVDTLDEAKRLARGEA